MVNGSTQVQVGDLVTTASPIGQMRRYRKRNRHTFTFRESNDI